MLLDDRPTLQEHAQLRTQPTDLKYYIFVVLQDFDRMQKYGLYAFLSLIYRD